MFLRAYVGRRDDVWRLLAGLFFLGIAVGAVWGAFSDVEIFFSSPRMLYERLRSDVSFPEVPAVNYLFLFLLLIASTSYLGIFIVPAIMAVKSCFISRTVALFYALFGFHGQVFSLFTIALPAALFLPGFFLLADGSYRASSRLLALRFRPTHHAADRGLTFNRLIISLLFILFFICYQYFLLPLILTKFF